MSVERQPGPVGIQCRTCVSFPMWTCWQRGGNRCVYFSLSLLECNKMQVHKGPPEEERLVACSLSLLKRLEEKTRVQESALASLGVAVQEKRSSVCVPGLYPKIPSLPLCQFHACLCKPCGHRRMPPGLSGPSPPPDWPYSGLSDVS